MKLTPSKWKVLLAFGLMWLAASADGFAITMEAALEYAMTHAETASMAQLQQQANQFAARGSTAYTRPQIKAQGRYLEMATNQELSLIVLSLPNLELAMEPQFLKPPVRDLAAELKFSQLLFSGGRITGSRDLESVRNRQSHLLKSILLRDLRYQVRTAFDSVLYQGAILDIQEERLQQRREELEDARALWEAGMVTRLDVRQADLSVNLAQDAHQKTEADLEQAVVQFNTVIGRDVSALVARPEGQLVPLADLPVLLDQTANALANDSLLEIQNAQETVQNARLRYQIAGGGYWPQLALVSSLVSQGEGFDDLYESAAVGLQVEWMIFDGGLIDSQCGVAQAEYRHARKALQQIKKQLAGRLSQLRVSQTSLDRRMGLQRHTVNLANENYEDARGQYRAGTITLTRVGEFSLAHTEAQFRLLRIYFEQRQIHHQTTSVLEQAAMPRMPIRSKPLDK